MPSYHSVRIDAVHFCPLEESLADKRRRKSIDPSSIPPLRLKLLERTVRARPDLAARVEYFKLPYMTRETYKAELARTISVLPNLHYVDLPDDFFGADPSTQILRDEMQTNCQQLRKMSYNAGAEWAFESLIQGNLWMNLEVLELCHLDVDLGVLRTALASLPALKDLKMTELFRQDDTAFQMTQNLPPFPALHKLQMEQMPAVTEQGIISYISRTDVREILSTLSLHHTGVQVVSLHSMLAATTGLSNLSITEAVDKPMPPSPPPPIACSSLKVLNFEVTSAPSAMHARTGPRTAADSYYTYLISSLHQNALPSLRKLYVRDPSFAQSLVRNTPAPSVNSNVPGGPRRFNQALEIFAKGVDDLDWAFTDVPAPDDPLPREPVSANHSRAKSDVTGKPVSAFNATLGEGPRWGGGARMSVMMGNGQGGFLAVPNAPSSSASRNPRHASNDDHNAVWPTSPTGWSQELASGDSRKSKGDLWR